MTYPETSPDKSAVTSALVQPITVPTHGPGGSFSVLAKVHISGSPTAALKAVRNTNTWPTWNTFCPSCKFPASKTPPQESSSTSENGGETGNSGEGWLEKGIVATITYVMSPGGSSGEQGIEITFLDHEFVSEEGKKGHRIAWKSTGRAHWSLHSERVMEFIDDGEGGCDYVCWETFGGGLGAAVKLTVGGKLRDRFGDYARDLKAFVEAGSVIP